MTAPTAHTRASTTLDGEDYRHLERIADEWRVSKGEALRRLIVNAGESLSEDGINMCASGATCELYGAYGEMRLTKGNPPDPQDPPRRTRVVPKGIDRKPAIRRRHDT